MNVIFKHSSNEFLKSILELELCIQLIVEHLFWKFSPSTICLSSLKSSPKQLWETNWGGRKFSKSWREGSMYPYVMWSSTYLYKLFRNSTCLYFFQVALLGTIYWKPLPLLIMGGSALIGGIIALLFLPETLGKPLPETMEDAVNLSRSRNGRTIFRWNIEILVVYLKKDCQAICCMCKMSTKIVHKNTRTC